MAEMATLRDALADSLRDLYGAEQQLITALLAMAMRASDGKLRHVLESHLAETLNHVTRLEQVFESIGLAVSGRRCAAIAAIIDGSEDGKAGGIGAGDMIRDAQIIATAQRAEHHEIAAYTSAAVWAKRLGLHDAAHLLRQNLSDERAADNALTALAEHRIVLLAAGGKPEGSDLVDRMQPIPAEREL